MNPGKQRREQVKDKKEEQVEYRTVLFVENSVGAGAGFQIERNCKKNRREHRIWSEDCGKEWEHPEK